MEFGTIRLENSEQYPFNNSCQTVALCREQANTDYFVQTEIVCAGGEAGEICISGKAVNGFQIAYTGSAPFAEIRYCIVGGAE